VPYIVILILSTFYSYDTFREEAHHENERTLAILTLQVNHYLEHPISEVEQFYHLWTNEEFSNDQIEESFFSYIDRFEVISREGYIVHTFPEIVDRVGFDASKSEAFKVKGVGKPQMLGTVMDIVMGKPALSIAVRTDADEVLVAILNLDGLRDFVKGLFEGIDQEVLITDKSGTIIADNSGEFVATRASFPHYSDIQASDKNRMEGFRFNEKTYSIYYNELFSDNWYLVVLNEELTIYAKVLRQLAPYVLLSLMIPLMFVGFSRTSNKFAKAFSHYYVITERIAGGDYNLPMTENVFREFNLLHDNFMRMVKGVQNREDEIHELNEELEELVATKEQDLQSAVLQLSVAQEQLFKAEKSRALQALVSGMTHELNTPLGIAITLNSHLEQLARDHRGQLEANHCNMSLYDGFFFFFRDGYMLLSKNLEYLAQLIDSFKRIAINQEQENIEVFSLKKYLNDILLVHKSELSRQRIEAVTDIEDRSIRSYPDLFGKLFSILIKNSMDHAFDSSITSPKIQLTCVFEDSYLSLYYRDNGIGVSEEILSNVFDPFVTSKRGSGNSGLGMSILNNIVVDQLKGTVDLSNGHPGVLFDIKIPLFVYSEALGIMQTQVKRAGD